MIFTEIMYFMLSMVKESTQNALERVFPQLKKENLHMSEQAFSKARQKIKWEAFEELFRSSVKGSYQEEWKLWRTYRLMAIDGSFIRLPSDSALLKHFGGLGPECKNASALVSLMYDLQNDIIVDAKIEPISNNERSLAEEHIEQLLKIESHSSEQKELIICDRGYPSYDLIKSLKTKQIAYVMRLQKGFIPEKKIKGVKDAWLRLGKEKLLVRVIRIVLKTGEEETLITNLSEQEIEGEAFKELYNKRWGIETKYKELKQKLETENFSGRLVDNIKQDFYAMMTVTNMIASCVRKANRTLQKKAHMRKNLYEYKVNVNHAIGVFKDLLIRVVIEEDLIARRYLINELVHRMEQRLVPIRANRQVPRKDSKREARFYLNHKSNC